MDRVRPVTCASSISNVAAPGFVTQSPHREQCLLFYIAQSFAFGHTQRKLEL